jgi:hypothetical protein
MWPVRGDDHGRKIRDTAGAVSEAVLDHDSSRSRKECLLKFIGAELSHVVLL